MRLNPDGVRMQQVARSLTDPVDDLLRGARSLIRDRAGYLLARREIVDAIVV